MRTMGRGKVAALLILGLVAPIAAGQEADSRSTPPPDSGSWWTHWFGAKDKPKDRSKEKLDAETVEKEPVVASPSPADLAALEQTRHERAYLRRLEVIDRLKLIATQTGNDELGRQAEELEERINALYRKQLAGGSVGPVSDTDVAGLSKKLDTSTAKPRPGQTEGVEARTARLLEGKR